MPKKNVTIENLAMMVQKGFVGVDKQFEGVDKQFEGVHKEFGKVYKKLDVIGDRLDNIEVRLEKIEKVILNDHRNRIERLEIEFFNFKNSIASEK